MTPPAIRSRQRAERHRERAVSHRADADLLLVRYGKPDSAGALLYEAAKQCINEQCINALANQAGQNPGSTGAKKSFLSGLASQPPVSSLDLEYGWTAASQLHIHTDRGHLEADEFRDAWVKAQAFVADMLLIHAGGR